MVRMMMLVAVAATAFVTASQAHGESRSADTWRALSCLMDRDDDRSLSKDEIGNFDPVPVRLLARNFADIDANRDGLVSYDEFAAFIARGRAEADDRFRSADADGSGGLSMTELEQAGPGPMRRLKRNFSAIDADRDGEVTLAERDRFVEELEKKKRERRAAEVDGKP